MSIPDPSHPKQVLVTGASGELGSALAIHYARPGVQLSLWGRDHARLSAVAEACRNAGASVSIRSLDLTKVESAVEAVVADDAASSFDLAIFASGLGDIRAADARVESPALVAQLGMVNYVAPASLAAALAERMVARGNGRIVLIGSAASFHALPFAAAYASSKAGLARYAEALRISVQNHGVMVTLVSPGFIDTAAARRTPGPKPLILKPNIAARRIAEAVSAGKGNVILPWPFALLRCLDRLLPRRLRDALLLRLTPPGW